MADNLNYQIALNAYFLKYTAQYSLGWSHYNTKNGPTYCAKGELKKKLFIIKKNQCYGNNNNNN